MLFQFLSLSSVFYVIAHVKHLDCSPHQKLFSPTDNCAPETPRQWPRLKILDITLHPHVMHLHNLMPHG